MTGTQSSELTCRFISSIMHRILFTISLLLFFQHAFGQTALPTSWCFASPPITSPPNGWTLGLGTNGNLTYSGSQNAVCGGVSARLDATGEFIKIWFAGSPGELSYFIKGTGIAPNPAFTGTFDVQESADDVTYTNLRSFTTNSAPTGTLTRFTHTPASTSRYIRFFYTEKLPGSNIALDSVMIKAPAASPSASMNVRVGGNTVVNQGTSIIGTAASTVFKLENIGTVEALAIDSIRFTGPAAADYTVTGTAPTSIAALSNQDLTIGFSPGANGTRLATMRIFNSDTQNNPYVINLYGIGGSFATQPSAPPGNLTASNISSFGFRLAMGEGNPKPEKYLLLRKQAGTLTEVPQNGVSYRVGDRIGDAVVAYVGDSAFSSLRPTYIFANSAYTFKAFSFNGPAGFENYLTTAASTVNIQTLGKNPGNYYNGIDPNSPSFLTDLSARINPHDTIFYSLYAPRLMAGFMARDTTGGAKVVNCVYTGIPYIYTGQFVWWTGQAGNPANLTREHTYAQSWMPSNTGAGWPNGSNGKELPEYNDMHNLFPADQVNGNAKRSNFPFGVVVTPTFTSPTGQGKLGLNASGQTVWEPRNDHKGDLARALMYMSVCYNGIGGRNWRFPVNQSPAVIMSWHLQDTVSKLEIARHEYIASQQKNRNPFIDNPQWYDRINFANMTLITGVEKINFAQSIATYPNPAAEQLHVDATLLYRGPIPYAIVDVLGKTIKTGMLSEAQSIIDMPAQKGMYYLQLNTESGQVLHKIMRQ